MNIKGYLQAEILSTMMRRTKFKHPKQYSERNDSNNPGYEDLKCNVPHKS